MVLVNDEPIQLHQTKLRRNGIEAVLHQRVSFAANSEFLRAGAWGVLRLTLESDGYQWEFVPVSGSGDSGRGTCH